jgi:hypothetical protein
MSDIAGVRAEFIQGAGYELAWEAILLAVVPFLFVRLQSSPERTSLPLLSASSCDFYSGDALRLKSMSGNECPWMSISRQTKGETRCCSEETQF